MSFFILCVEQSVKLNIYSPNASSTSAKVPCNSSLCTRGDRCASPNSNCPYQIRYLSNGTSSTGVLVEDVLHLVSNDKNSKAIPARVTLGYVEFFPCRCVFLKLSITKPFVLEQLWSSSDRCVPRWCSSKRSFRAWLRRHIGSERIS